MKRKLKKSLVKGGAYAKQAFNQILTRKVLWLTLFLVLCYFFGGGIAVFTSASSKTSFIESSENWGLGFGAEGQQPTGMATADELAKYNAYYLDDTEEKVIYLTFDAGFENGYTPLILDTLKKHKVPATFFLVGNYIKTSPELVNRMVEEGHIVANHTYSHPDMSKISSMESFKKELEDLEKEYKDCTGEEMKKYYRPPQGIYSEENLEMASELGYNTLFWSLAYVDWYVDNQPSKAEALDKLIGRIHPGAVVLLHSTSKTNGEVLDEVIAKWKELGYTFASIDQLVSK